MSLQNLPELDASSNDVCQYLKQFQLSQVVSLLCFSSLYTTFISQDRNIIFHPSFNSQIIFDCTVWLFPPGEAKLRNLFGRAD